MNDPGLWSAESVDYLWQWVSTMPAARGRSRLSTGDFSERENAAGGFRLPADRLRPVALLPPDRRAAPVDGRAGNRVGRCGRGRDRIRPWISSRRVPGPGGLRSHLAGVRLPSQRGLEAGSEAAPRRRQAQRAGDPLAASAERHRACRRSNWSRSKKGGCACAAWICSTARRSWTSSRMCPTRTPFPIPPPAGSMRWTQAAACNPRPGPRRPRKALDPIDAVEVLVRLGGECKQERRLIRVPLVVRAIGRPGNQPAR